jgi:hypothetical protein
MTTYRWSEVREKAALEFGRHPDAELEAELLQVFQERPAFVVSAIEDVMRAFESGRIHSPWMLLRKQVKAAPLELVVANDEVERERAVARAEQWLRVCGLHFDRFEEVEDDLFGDRGKLQTWASDESLRERLRTLWKAQRARGEQIEAEAEERGQRARGIVMTIRGGTTPSLDLAKAKALVEEDGHDPSTAEIPF